MYYIYTDEKLDLKKIFFWVLILKQDLLTQETFYSALICVSWTTLIYLHWRFAAVLRASIIDWHRKICGVMRHGDVLTCAVFFQVSQHFFVVAGFLNVQNLLATLIWHRQSAKKKSKWDRPFRSTIVRRGFTSFLLLWLKISTGLNEDPHRQVSYMV